MCFLVQETHFSREESLKIKGYTTFELIRSENKYGGIMVGFDNSYNYDPILIMKGTDDIEIIVIEIKIGARKGKNIFWIWLSGK